MECWILALPLLILILLLLAVVLACFKRWKWAVGVLVVAFIVNWYGEVFALHPLGGCSSETGERLTVMTFNIHAPSDNFDKRIAGIAELIREENPDVVFLCEIFTPYKHYDEQLDSILKRTFPYSTYEGQTQWGNAFYSKHSIESVQVLSIPIGKCLPLASISIKGKSATLLGCHLSSNNYVDAKTKLEVDDISTHGEAKQYFATLEKGYRSRRQDVDSLALQLADVDMSRLIALGDMNDIGGSYTIRAFGAMGLKDAWWKGGFGLGGTRKVFGFPFRIDHIMYGDGLRLYGVKDVDTNGLSDHDAVVAKFGIN